MVHLEFRGNDVSLLQWLISGRDGKLSCLSVLNTLPAYLRTFAENENIFSKEMMTQKFYLAQGRKPYSPQFLRLALLLRYISAQAYKLPLENFPMPSLSLLKKLKRGNVDVLNACKYLR